MIDSSEDMTEGISVGGTIDENNFFQGEISSLEFYNIKTKKKRELPTCLKEILIKNQMIIWSKNHDLVFRGNSIEEKTNGLDETLSCL